MRKALISSLILINLACGAALADGLKDKAKDATDQDCNVQKAAKGAAMKSTVGIGNRCCVAETARGVAEVDGKGKNAKKKVSK